MLLIQIILLHCIVVVVVLQIILLHVIVLAIVLSDFPLLQSYLTVVPPSSTVVLPPVPLLRYYSLMAISDVRE